MKGRVTVGLKGGVLDVQGKTIEAALGGLGFEGVGAVRVGKVFEVELETDDADAARTALTAMAEKLLANPVMERFQVEVDGVRFTVVSFPGSNCDDDCVRVVTEVLGETATKVRHTERDLGRPDVVLLPGGFSYGDYLRCGAIAARSAAMESVATFARGGGPVLGICNGFQVLTEAGLLPGALLQNAGLDFLCEDTPLQVGGRETPFTRGIEPGRRLVVPIAHHEGRYVADSETLARLEGEGQVVLRYLANPNGSSDDIAGICNASGNVVGMMPHPERCSEPLLGNTDGRALFDAVLEAL